MVYLKSWFLQDSSLRKQARIKLMQNHGALFTGTIVGFKNVVFDYFTDRKNWFSVVALVVFLLGIFTFIHIDVFAVFSFKEGKVLADQRTSNVATIISMTLAVVGLLMSNLAIKEPLAYSILFKQSYLYFIIYFTLASIFMLMIISTLRDSFKGEYEFLYNRLVLSGTYLALIIVFFIGHLFRTIIKVINPLHIYKSLERELLKEAKQILRESLFKQYCIAEYHAMMKSANIELNSLNVAFDAAVASTESKVNDDPELKPMYVFDVNLKAIKKKYSKKPNTSKHYYSILQIGKHSNEYDNFIWDYGRRNTDKEKSFLKSCVILTDKELENETPTTYRDYFDQKLEEYTDNRKHNEVKNILQMYLELYDLQMQQTVHE